MLWPARGLSAFPLYFQKILYLRDKCESCPPAATAPSAGALETVFGAGRLIVANRDLRGAGIIFDGTFGFWVS